MRILGIDPGSLHTGYALVDVEGNALRSIRVDRWSLRGEDMGARLLQLDEALSAAVAEYRPDVAAIETVFVNQNPNSALKLGQARGVILCALARAGVATAEYTPATIKQTICGSGRADKTQVGWMVQRLLGLRGEKLAADAADAAAVAICHHQHAPARRYRIAGT